MLFKRLVEINIESRLDCIDIYDEDCIESKSRGNNKKNFKQCSFSHDEDINWHQQIIF